MLKVTSPSCSAFVILSKAYDNIGEIVNKVNDRVRKIENINKLIAVNKGVTFAPTCKFDILGDHNRIFQLEEEFLINFKPGHGYLFNDVLLIARPVGKGNAMEINQLIWISGSEVRNIVSVGEEEKYEIEFIERGEKIGLIFSFKSKFRKKKWITVLEKVIVEAGCAGSKNLENLGDVTFRASDSGSKKRSRTSRVGSLKRGNVKNMVQQFETPQSPQSKSNGKLVVDTPERKRSKNKVDKKYEELRKQLEEEQKLRIEIEQYYKSQVGELEGIIKCLQSELTILKDRIRNSDSK